MSIVPQILAIVLFALGCFCLSALLLTVNSSERVPRHPVFVNFLRTWLLWGSYMLYVSIAIFAMPVDESSQSLVRFQSALRDILWMSTQVSTLNLVIHTWITMKTWRKRQSINGHSTRTKILVATPYISGLVAVVELFPIRPRLLSGRITFPVDLAMGCLFLSVTAVTTLCDMVILVTFWRDRRILQKANIRGVMSVFTLMRLLVLCLYQLLLTVFCGILLTMPVKIPTTLIPVAESLYPLLVFFLVGLRRDILYTWFPFCGGSGERADESSRGFQSPLGVNVTNVIDGLQSSPAVGDSTKGLLLEDRV